MPLYESTFIARQDISPADVDKLTKAFSAVITGNGGKVVKSEYWGLRNLAFKINKNKKGHYVMLALDAPSAAVKEMERQLKINEDIIRTLTVKVDAIEEGQSAILRNTEANDNRGFEVNIDPEIEAI